VLLTASLCCPASVGNQGEEAFALGTSVKVRTFNVQINGWSLEASSDSCLTQQTALCPVATPVWHAGGVFVLLVLLFSVVCGGVVPLCVTYYSLLLVLVYTVVLWCTVCDTCEGAASHQLAVPLIY
jgi:hypothetical protein